jgi:hypothetical protein
MNMLRRFEAAQISEVKRIAGIHRDKVQPLTILVDSQLHGNVTSDDSQDEQRLPEPGGHQSLAKHKD